MALPKFEFTKTWNSAEDFPSYESDEAQVRADMQYLYDELLSDLNQLSEETVAGAIPFESSSAVSASDVQSAIEAVQAQIAGIALGDIPDDSITSEKYKDGSLTNEKVADGTLQTEKLADGAVETEKLADGAVTNDKIADGTIEADKLAGGLTRDLFAEGSFANFATLQDGRLTPAQRILGVVSTSSSKTLALTDAGKVVQFTGGGEATLTIPNNSAVAFPVGTEIEVFRRGTGTVTLSPAADVNLLLPNTSSKNLLQYERLRLKKWDTNTWSVEGRVPDKGVGTAQLADKAVATAKIADSAVKTAQIADAAVATAKIADGAITAPKIGYGTKLPTSPKTGQIFLLKV